MSQFPKIEYFRSNQRDLLEYHKTTIFLQKLTILISSLLCGKILDSFVETCRTATAAAQCDMRAVLAKKDTERFFLASEQPQRA